MLEWKKLPPTFRPELSLMQLETRRWRETQTALPSWAHPLHPLRPGVLGMGGTNSDAYSVRTQLPVRLEPICAGDVRAVARSILEAPSRNLSNVDPELADWLVRIESKLDCLLATMGLPQDSSPLAEAPTEIELSEDAIVIFEACAHTAGTFMRVELDLPGPPIHQVRCLARVADRDSDAPQPCTRLVFEVLREEDHAAIVSHTLAVQRRELRLRSGIAGAPE